MNRCSCCGKAAANSVGVSALAAVLTVICAAPIAVLAVRYPGQFSRWLERLGFIGFALPGIVIALGLVYFGANYAPWLYQSLAMLAVAYVTLFLPAAVGSLRTSLVQVRPELEDAARSLGKTPLVVLLTITLPLVRPGILAGAALVFLLTMKELPATLILSPIGFTTLASSIWAAAQEAFFAPRRGPGPAAGYRVLHPAGNHHHAGGAPRGVGWPDFGGDGICARRPSRHATDALHKRVHTTSAQTPHFKHDLCGFVNHCVGL